MAYAYQTFNSGAVFTASQAQQIEDNIRDHRHGVDGVGASGASWAVSSVAASQAIASTDAGKLFKCYGDLALTFATAGTLGTSFGAAFVNVGSGRIALTAASGQWIHNNSVYALCPGEGVVVQSDGTELIVVGGQDNAKLARVVTVTSTATVEILKCFPNDFLWYEVRAAPNLEGIGLVQMRVSTDSGSSYISAGYANTTGGQTAEGNLTLDNAASRQVRFMQCEFHNGIGVESIFNVYHAYSMRAVGTSLSTDDNRFFTTSAGVINAIQFKRNAGAFSSGSVFELYGRGRTRR
jgi:hypothetical protein